MGVISFEKIITALFVFSLVGVAINASGIMDTNIPTQDISSQQAQITAMQTTADNPGQTFFNSLVGPIMLLGKALQFLIGLSGILVNLPGTLGAWGIPGYIVTMLMGMIFLSLGFWIVAWWTGRRPT